MKNGLIHIYCGDGKGKTTAAVGLAVRCAGAGGRVLFMQFLKDGTSSEFIVPIKGIDIVKSIENIKFVWEMTDEEKLYLSSRYAGIFRDTKIKSKDYDMLVLDEIAAAISCGFIDEADVIDFLENKPTHLEVVITGRDPSGLLIAAADYVTEMNKVKHPYDRGIGARRGIEF